MTTHKYHTKWLLYQCSVMQIDYQATELLLPLELCIIVQITSIIYAHQYYGICFMQNEN